VGKLPIKRTKKLAEAERTGVLKAEEKYHSKLFSNKKQTGIWLAKQFERLIEKIDPLEAVAILTATFFIKQGIEWTENIPTTILQKDSLIRTVIKTIPFFGPLAVMLTPEAPPEFQEKVEEALDSPQAEVIQYLLSFVVAYIVVKHPEAIMSLGGNILGVAKGLIGGLG